MIENECYVVEILTNDDMWGSCCWYFNYKDAKRECDRMRSILETPVRIIRKVTRSSIVYESSTRICYLTFDVVIKNHTHEKTTYIEDLQSGFKLKLPYKEFKTPEELYAYGQSYLDMLKGMKQ